MVRRISIILAGVVLAISFGCSSVNKTPFSPLQPGEAIPEGRAGHNMLWGMYQFEVNQEHGTVEATSLRAASFHLNALPFLEPGGQGLIYLTLESAPVFNGNILGIDIGLRHPFVGLTEFTGFDVNGIVISKGSIGGFLDPDIRIPGAGDWRLLNADGHSRWWNPDEFPQDGTIFGYTDGVLGTPDSLAGFNATVNGYKYFCDDINNPDDSLSVVGLANRGLFNAGQKCVRHYSIEMGTGFVFNYAVDASWTPPNGDPPWQAPGSFPPGANRVEPWWISVTNIENNLWNDGSGSGGSLSFSIDVHDWYNIDQMNVIVESPGNFTALTDIVSSSSGEGYQSYLVDITSASPTADEITVLISAISEQADFGGFITGTKTTAYKVLSIPVSNEGMPLSSSATAQIESYFDGFGPAGDAADPIPTEWYLTLDASASTGAIAAYLWEMDGDDLFDDATGMVVSAGFPTIGTHIIKLRVTDGSGGQDTLILPGSYEVVAGTYVDAAAAGSPDGSRDNPYTSITSALGATATDEYILVRGDNGTGGQNVYTGNLTISTSNAGTRVQGYYGDYAIDEPPNQTGFIYVTGNAIIFDGFEVTGPSMYTAYPYGHWAKIGAENGQDLVFGHIYVHDLNQVAGGVPKVFGIYTNATAVARNILEVTVACSYIKNQAGWGAIFDFENATFDRLGADTYGGGYYDNGTADCNMNNCIWTDVGSTGYTYLWNVNSVIYNCVNDTPTLPDGGNYYAGTTPGVGCIIANPNYVSPMSDHHLQTGSACIDTGDPSITDYDATPSDMGCYGGPYGDWNFED